MIYNLIAGLIQKGLDKELIKKEDTVYVQNQVMNLLHLHAFPEGTAPVTNKSIPDLLESITSYAVEQEVIDNVLDDKEIFTANIMNCFLPRPSVVNEIFHKKYQESPEAATRFFYELSKNSNYIQMNRIRKNISYKTETKYGTFDITINLSKPEKDPEQIKREKELKQDLHYPKCLLCVENEGYSGRIGYPARANHRIIKLSLLGENWYLQYSPYVYYNEHSILLAEDHREMKINKQTFERLVAFTEIFPHYFIGSNADLPIVGGSILSHDHYQAGNYEFAITNAKEALTFQLEQFPDIHAAVLKWPLSVIRLKSKDMDQLVQAGDHILKTWRDYSDESLDIRAYTENTSHNTITPIARNRDGAFELDLALRNNRTSEIHPQGIFHPHSDVHHIKKENIGLIEVMGLAVLPPRLNHELKEIRKFLDNKPCEVKPYHQAWAAELREKYGKPHNSKEVLEKELGKKFEKVLEDAGVFKEQQGFEKFLQTLNGGQA